jgi:hypothetical protein
MYPSTDYLNELKENLRNTSPQMIDWGNAKSEKRAFTLFSDLKSYGLQLDCIAVINQIQDSHLLGMNEVVVPHLVEEYKLLRNNLREVEKKIKKLKQLSEMNDLNTNLLESMKVKEIGSFLYNDLEFLLNSFSLNLDPKLEMQKFK